MGKFKALIFVSIALIFIALMVLFSGEKIKAFFNSSAKVQTEEEKTSYLLGYVLTENAKKSETNLQGQAFLKGVQDSINNQAPVLKQEEMEGIHKKFKKRCFWKNKKRKEKKTKWKDKNFLKKTKVKKVSK